ncbi:unnamed protein product, partial [Choristocarpus tenellus]
EKQRRCSNLSFQRRERAIWLSCLQKIQDLRRGGSWHGQVQHPQGQHRGWVRRESGRGSDVFNSSPERTAEAELLTQLDLLATLTYPNSSLSPQDAGSMVAGLCEAVPPSSELLCSRVAQFFISLSIKQQRVTFSGWQMDATLDLFLSSLTETKTKVSLLSHEVRTFPCVNELRLHPCTTHPPLPTCSVPDRIVRALAQLLYGHGDRLGMRFDNILPALLCYADVTAVDLDARHAALDGLSNLCLKNWAGLSPPNRTALCGALARNFMAHWRCPTGTPAEAKVLSSAARGLTHATTRGG